MLVLEIMTEHTFLNLLAMLLLGSVAANFWHSRGHDGERFVYYPKVGVWRAVNRTWMVAQSVFAILYLAGVFPLAVFFPMLLSWSITIALYSIWFRQTHRRQPN